MKADKYGCWNTDRQEAYPVAESHFDPDYLAFVQTTTFVRDDSSQECRYDQRANDAKCEGCRK